MSTKSPGKGPRVGNIGTRDETSVPQIRVQLPLPIRRRHSLVLHP